jgi:zinc protease
MHRPSPPTPAGPRPYLFPAVERRELENGIAVWACELAGTGLVSARLLLNAGVAAEPIAEAGLAALTAWGVGEGTEDLDSLEFADRRERIAADIGAGVGWDSWDMNVESPAEYAAEAMALGADALLAPGFREVDVDRIRGLRLNQFRYMHAEPGARAVTAALAQLFTPASRYSMAIEGDFKVVARLTPEELRRFHASRLDPAGAVLVIAGDIRPEAAFGIAAQTVGGWRPAAPDVRPPLPNEVAVDRTRVVVYDRPGSAQSVVATVQGSVSWAHPDRAAIDMLGAIVGGLFSSRLNMRLREEKGYTYGASAGFELRRDGGLFISFTTVDVAVTAPTVQDTMAVLTKTHEGGVTDDEVRMAVDFDLGNWPLGRQAPGGIRDALSELAVYKAAPDYWDRRREALAALSAREVSEAAATHLNPRRTCIVVVGDAERVLEPLRALDLGPVEVIDDPGPPEA